MQTNDGSIAGKTPFLPHLPIIYIPSAVCLMADGGFFYRIAITNHVRGAETLYSYFS